MVDQNWSYIYIDPILDAPHNQIYLLIMKIQYYMVEIESICI